MSQVVSIILSLHFLAHAIVGCCLHHAHFWSDSLHLTEDSGDPTVPCKHSSLASHHCCHREPFGHEPIPSHSCDDDQCVFAVLVCRNIVPIDDLTSHCELCSFHTLQNHSATVQRNSLCRAIGVLAELPVRTHLFLSVLLR